MTDELILVNAEDEEIGFKEKEKCHLGNGILHRAFSVFIFNNKGELLIQQRAENKMLWPLFWSNSCCSHPRKGELIEDAAARRTVEECGIACHLKLIYKFQYSAKFEDIGSENEICNIFIGKSDCDPLINSNEIKNWKWISIKNLTNNILSHPEEYTPWFKAELIELNSKNLI